MTFCDHPVSYGPRVWFDFKSPISLAFVMAGFKIRNLLLIHGTETSLCIVYDFLLQSGRGRIRSRFPHRSC